MKIIFTGATGLIGRYFCEENPSIEKNQILAMGRSPRPDFKLSGTQAFAACDFSNLTEFKRIFKDFKPNVIVHAGGEGNVDAVQKDPEQFTRTALEFQKFLLEEALTLKAKVVTFSSNAIYDGEHAPYNEKSKANPLSAYGKLKVKLDAETRTYPGKWIIMRPIVSYGWNFPFGRVNPVSAFLPKIIQEQSLRVVDDQWENPVYAGDVAEALWKCLETDFTGELNVGGGDARVSRYDWISQVAKVFGHPNTPLERAKMQDFAAITPRPKDTSFDTTLLRNSLGYLPKTVEEGAQAMRNDLKRSPLK